MTRRQPCRATPLSPVLARRSNTMAPSAAFKARVLAIAAKQAAEEPPVPEICSRPWDFRGDPIDERPPRLPADSWQRRIMRPRQRAKCGHGGPAHAKGLCRSCYRAERYAKMTMDEREASWAQSEEIRRAKVRQRYGLPLDASDEDVKSTAMRLAALKRWRNVKAEAIKRARRANRYVTTGSIDGWKEVSSALPSRGHREDDHGEAM